MGSMNFGLFPMLERRTEFKHAWEAEMLEASRDLIFLNTFRDIEYVLKTLSETGTRFEFECYDVGHLYNLHHVYRRGLVKPPLFIPTVFGILGGIGTHPKDVLHMKRTADRLFGIDYHWSVLGAGRHQMPIVAQAAVMGGNVRVGLEDSVPAGWLRRTQHRCAKCGRSSKGLASQLRSGFKQRGALPTRRMAGPLPDAYEPTQADKDRTEES